MDTFMYFLEYWLKMFFLAFLSNAKSGAIDQVTLGDQSVGAIDLLATPCLFQR